jgi:hypothetical protein
MVGLKVVLLGNLRVDWLVEQKGVKWVETLAELMDLWSEYLKVASLASH